MKPKLIETARGILLAAAVLAIAVFAYGCGGGGGSTAIAPLSLTDAQTSTITGVLEQDNATGRVAGREASLAVTGARVYAFPADTPLALLLPDIAKPYAQTGADGAFTIFNAPLGRLVLVVDLNADGLPDRLVPEFVANGKAVDIGRKKISELTQITPAETSETDQPEETETPETTPEPAVEPAPLPPATTETQSSTKPGCYIKLDKVIYGTGQTLVMTVTGYNDKPEAVKCGVKILLRKGKTHPEVWRSDFNDPATFVLVAPNSPASGVIRKVIPETWALTNSPAGSDYHVYPILESGAVWGRGDNFNILKNCEKNNACSTVPDTNPIPDPPPAVIACSDNIDCDDNFEFTLDTCVNPGTTEAYCLNADF